MDPADESLLPMFVVESEEGLRVLEEALVLLETQADHEMLSNIFRAVHTLKGNAGMLGFVDLARVAHAAEDLLELVRDGRVEVTAPLVSLLLKCVDALRQMVGDAAAGLAQPRPEHDWLLERLATAAAGELVSAPAVAPVARTERRQTPGRRREDLLAWAERTKSLRVDKVKLDRMLDLTGEIAISRGRLSQILESQGNEAALEVHREAEQLYLDLQELVVRARMVPVGPLFHQQIRTVRDLAASLGKVARLDVFGEDVEVDTTVVEHLRDPLVHMLRNALDHGIEPPDVRKSKGKDPCGRITLRAWHEGGSIVIQVADDGEGLDRDRIAERARTLGLEPDKLADRDLFALVFEPGFSTAEAVTDLSGRGVGMDVVRRNIDALHGSVEIGSPPGAGATVTIRLPLTLAIIAGLAVGVENETYIVPLDAVVECLELTGDSPGRGGDGVMNVRGEALPYLRLRDVFGLLGSPENRENVVVVRHPDGLAGLAVDRLHGESQTIIKPLGTVFRSVPGIAGSAILGSGRVALILDVPGLIRMALASRAEAPVAAP